MPSQYPEVQSYPHLQSLLAKHIDMQFEDLRVLLGLPLVGSAVGANLATASLLFNVISGASIVFHETSWGAFTAKTGSGVKFKSVLRGHFPFAEIPFKKETVIDVFYTYSRNPLAHSFGLGDPSTLQVSIAKKALTPAQFTQLEDDPALPVWSRPALTPTVIQPGSSYQLSISGLYWGIHRMLQSIFADRSAEFASRRSGTGLRTDSAAGHSELQRRVSVAQALKAAGHGPPDAV